MSKQFYSFLANEIIIHFKDNPLKPGEKYNIQFETEEQVKDLYEKLKENNSLVNRYEYIDSDGVVTYNSYQLDFDYGVSLIVASTAHRVQPEFLTTLRNLVVEADDRGNEKKAILFIHNSTLDSIVNGTESFSKEGMPFHVDSIQRRIRDHLNSGRFTLVEKTIIELDLERKKDPLFNDNSSIFEYTEILDTLDKGSIESEQYRNFGIFYDKALLTFENKSELKKRLEENAKEYNRIDRIHNDGDPEIELERYYDGKGLTELKKKEWRDLDYNDVKKFAEDFKNKAVLEYIENEDVWDKADGISKVKSRIRNILLFNEDLSEYVIHEFQFTDYLRSDYIENKSCIGNMTIEVSGKRLKVTLVNDSEGINLYKIVLRKDSIKFEFRIALLNCRLEYFESIKSMYSVIVGKKKGYIALNTNDDVITFNAYGENKNEQMIYENNERVKLSENTKTVVKISEDFDYEADDNIAKFNVEINNFSVPFEVEGNSKKILPIDGLKVWKNKRECKNDFNFLGKNRLSHGTTEYYVSGEFKKSLDLERMFLESEGLCCIETNGIKEGKITLDDKVTKKYNEILDYFRNNKTLPSLAYLNDDLRNLYNDFLTIYLNELDQIQDGYNLNRQQINLFKLGTLKRERGEKELILTPVHPLNMAYQLHIDQEISNEKVDENIIKKFNSTYLLPFITDREDEMYVPVEQNHSPEHKIYVNEKLPRYKSSRDFVSKLVGEKIEEFIGHFHYMFDLGQFAPIKINLINTGDSKEILEGIFKYYVKQLENDKQANIIPIDLYIYSDRNITNSFEEVALNDNLKELKMRYNINLSVDNISEEDVLNLYRENVRFYSKHNKDKIEYAHITFLEMSNEIKKVSSNMHDIPSGVILNGLVSGVPSVFRGELYRTGFGVQYAKTDTQLMKVAMKLNALSAAIAGYSYASDQTKVIAIPTESELELDQIYDASHWVTFIDPKVDLNFFKNDPNAKDLLIIHYSDQYTTAGGYDAITVTRKSGPYQQVIEEFLDKQGLEDVTEISPKIINMFNAINGDWLLRLLSNRAHRPKEKISILSAVKLGLAKFKSDNIIWVPISLEEILRVSSGAGLKKSEGFLSAKSLGLVGSKSDDLLFVGIEEIDEEVFVWLYPVEVKTGKNNRDTIHKGIRQAIETKEQFVKRFFPKKDGTLTVKQKVYRNFLMQIVVNTAEKYDLYNVSSEINWSRVTNSSLREKLLNEEYTLINSIESSLRKSAVISFKSGVVNTRIDDSLHDEDVLVFEISERVGVECLTQEISEIRERIEVIEISFDQETPIDVEKVSETQEVATPIPEILEELGEPVFAEDQTEFETPNRHIEILFGQNQISKQMIYWEPSNTNKVLHTNTGIIGTMGTGKTQFTKSLVTQIHRESKYNINSKDIGILIFDYKGDYNKNQTEFINATDATVYEPFWLPFNPLSIIKAKNSKRMLPLHIANSLKVTLAKAFGLGIKQETLLRDLIMESYEIKGIIKNKPDTWDLPAPTLKDVYDIYTNREDLKHDSLYAAFSNLIGFEIFEPKAENTKNLFDLINGVTVIDLSIYDSDIQNLVVAITLDLFYSQMQAHGHSEIQGQFRQLNKMILVDEADNFLSKDFETLKKILKEGREFGVGTILSTQLLSHFSTGENRYSDYILTWVVHNVAEISSRDAKYIFNAQTKADQERICAEIKRLDKHYSYVKMGDNEKALYMKDRAFWELMEDE